MTGPHQSLTPIDARLASAPPALVTGVGAGFAWEEFFAARVSNRHTRVAYERAVRRFLAWAEARADGLASISPGMVGAYLRGLPLAAPSKKLHLAALRAFFDCLCERHITLVNPAATVRGERHAVIEGLTPEITPAQARRLLDSIDASTAVGKRDAAVVATLVFTAARAGAVAGLRLRHLVHDGTQHLFRFTEKGGKVREIPLRHDLERLVFDYLAATGATLDESRCLPPLASAERDLPLFRAAPGRGGFLGDAPFTAADIGRMVKRRLIDAGLPTRLSPHSFRVCTVTDLLEQGVPLEDVQYLAGHCDPRTTRLYDRRQRRVTRNVVERISV